jgi:magnesium transporter
MPRRKRRSSPRLAHLLQHQRRFRIKPPALPPGTPLHTGEQKADQMRIEVFSYDRNQLEQLETPSPHECLQFQDPDRVTWLHVTGLHEAAKITQLGECFGMHPLLIEDVLNIHGRSKLDQWEDRLFMTLRMLVFDAAASRVDNQRFAMFVAPRLVLTFAEASTRVFAPVFQRIKEGAGRIRGMGADYLAWALLDAVVDHYLGIVDALDERLIAIDEGLQDGFDDLEIAHLYRMHSEVVIFHRLVRPVREIASSLSHSECPLLTHETNLFYRDLYDHAVHLVEQAADLHDHANSLREFFLATVNNRMNEVMKVLACVSTIFLPLTFLAGIYGMNFEYLPEFKWRWGYPFFWLVVILVVTTMLFIFRRKRWL